MKRKILVAGAAVVLAAGSVAVGATAFAAPSAPTSVLKACVSNKDGAMRLVSSTAYKCPKGQRLVKWNVVGPAGAKGATGPAGPQGAPGTPGAPGRSDLPGEAGDIRFTYLRTDYYVPPEAYDSYRIDLSGFPADTVVEVSAPPQAILNNAQQPVLVLTRSDGTAQVPARGDCRDAPPSITARGKGFTTSATVDPVAAGEC